MASERFFRTGLPPRLRLRRCLLRTVNRMNLSEVPAAAGARKGGVTAAP